MRNKVKTRKQIIEALNKLDMKCIDEGLHFYDLKSLYEAIEDKLSAEDKNVIRNVLNTPNLTAKDVMAVMDSRLEEDIEDPIDELYGDDAFNDDKAPELEYKVSAYYEESLRGLEDDLNTNDYEEALDFVWEKCQQGLWVEIFNTETGNSEIYSPDKFDETSTDPRDLKESMEDGQYDYYNVSDEYGVIGEYPTYEEAKNNCGEGCTINGVIQYGADAYEETPLTEDYNVEFYNSLDADFGMDPGAGIYKSGLDKATAKSIARNKNKNTPDFISYNAVENEDNLEESFNEEDFRDWLEKEYYPGFDTTDLSDEEYYELEDAYRNSIKESLNEDVNQDIEIPYYILFDMYDGSGYLNEDTDSFEEYFDWDFAYEAAEECIHKAESSVEETYPGFEADFGNYEVDRLTEFYDLGTLIIPNTYKNDVDRIINQFTKEVTKFKTTVPYEAVVEAIPATYWEPEDYVTDDIELEFYVEEAGVDNEV